MVLRSLPISSVCRDTWCRWVSQRGKNKGCGGCCGEGSERNVEICAIGDGFSVVQDDVVMGTLTVRENLNFSAALRLPAAIPQEEKEQKVNKLIQELGLGRVADSRVIESSNDQKGIQENT